MMPFLAAVALAQEPGDAALYAPEPPPGSAFLRVLNGQSAVATAEFGGRRVTALAGGAASPYVPLPAGPVAVSSGPAKGNGDLEAGRFYTAALVSSGVRILADPAPPSRLKAGLVLYNLLQAGPLDLVTADATIRILEDVAPLAVGGREVNALKVALAVEGNARVGACPESHLVRAAVYSVIAWSGPKGPQVSCIENETGS